MQFIMHSSSFCVLRTVLRSSLCKCRLAKKDALLPSRCLASQYSTEPLPLPNEALQKTYSPKIQKLVDDISHLNLLEVADLNELLKVTLKIQDAPMMAMGAAVQASPVAAKEEVVEEMAPVQSTFSVKLTSFDADKKIGLIKEIKNLIPGTNLVQAKKFVESAPVIVKKDLLKEEAETLLKSLLQAGAKAEME